MIGDQPRIAAFAIAYEADGVRSIRKPRGFSPWLNFKTGLFHQGVLCSRNLFEELGVFDTRLTIAMDYEFWLRAYRRGIRPNLYEHTLSVMRDTGVSAMTDWTTLKRRFDEERYVHAKHSRSVLDKSAYSLYWSVYLPYRYLKNRF